MISDFFGILLGSCSLLAEAIIGFWLMEGYTFPPRQKKSEAPQAKKKTSRNREQAPIRVTRKRKDKLATVLTLLGVAAGFGSWGYSVLAPNPSVSFGSVLLIFGVACCGFAFWEYFEWSTRIKALVLAGAAVLSAYWGVHWVRYITRSSFTFMVPGVVLNGNTWDFLINHRGPKSSESVQILFTDVDQRDEILSKHPTVLTPQDIRSYERILQYPEVNPEGRGQIFALQFQWTPLVLDHEHYTMDITDRDHQVHQELQIEHVNGKWFWATQIKDSNTGSQLLTCKDEGFPYGEKAPIPCFPKITGYAD